MKRYTLTIEDETAREAVEVTIDQGNSIVIGMDGETWTSTASDLEDAFLEALNQALMAAGVPVK
jgi:hypothetical protein